VQIGDPGYTTYTSLFPEAQDGKSSSDGFDLAFGYNDTRKAMSDAEIEASISDFADAAGRVQEAGADGVEVTATKGYLIHQFLNPGINRRRDAWGGDAQRRFHFLARAVEAIRQRVGRDYLFGIRLSSADYNYSPLQLALFRYPPVFGSRERWRGNDLAQMLDYGARLRDLGVDYLHVVSGYGFPNPRDTPGPFPLDEIRMFFNSTRHLSRKAAVRATLLNALPTPLARWIMSLGWQYRPALNLAHALEFKKTVGLVTIVNGGFQERSTIADALGPGRCDMVSMARALIANPDLVDQFRNGVEKPAAPCSYCNRCIGRTPTSPLGCYDERRFASHQAMVDEILRWNQADPA
jgi:2,4-dienoyl-CoA reductase (NADPH2)